MDEDDGRWYVMVRVIRLMHFVFSFLRRIVALISKERLLGVPRTLPARIPTFYGMLREFNFNRGNVRAVILTALYACARSAVHAH